MRSCFLIPISPPAPDLSVFSLGSGLLTHRGSPSLHAEPQSKGQQRLALHPAPRAGRNAQKSGARSLSGSAPRKRRGDGTCAAAQGFGALRARVPQLPPRLQERLRCQSERMIPAAGQLLAFRGAQVMPRAGRGNATIHLRLSRSPGTQCWVAARAETLERGGGAMQGGASLRDQRRPSAGSGAWIAAFPRPLHLCISPTCPELRLAQSGPTENVPGATTPYLAERKCNPQRVLRHSKI